MDCVRCDGRMPPSTTILVVSLYCTTRIFRIFDLISLWTTCQIPLQFWLNAIWKLSWAKMVTRSCNGFGRGRSLFQLPGHPTMYRRLPKWSCSSLGWKTSNTLHQSGLNPCQQDGMCRSLCEFSSPRLTKKYDSAKFVSSENMIATRIMSS